MVIWLFLSISPTDTITWAAENILLFMSFIFILETHGRVSFSISSYIFIFIFACLQTIGSHYTYAQVPMGFEVAQYYQLERNHYDRFVHFCFGLLLALPVKEYFADKIIIKSTALYLMVFVFVFLGLGGFYEVLEWGYTYVVNSENIDEFLGEQGDSWDAQKDIALAGLGAFITLSLLATFGKKRHYANF